MKVLNVRNLAFEYLKSVFLKPPRQSLQIARRIKTKAERLNEHDRALFQELTAGVLREWYFLEWVLCQHIKRKPRLKVQCILALSIYQFIFLNRIPEHAIFSEAKILSQAIPLSSAEQHFVHGVLKSIAQDKGEFKKQYDEVLKKLQDGNLPENNLEWAVLNCSINLVKTMTVIENDVDGKRAQHRAIQALIQMKQKPLFLGYRLPLILAQSSPKSFQSSVVPRAVVLNSGKLLKTDLANGALRVQGEASQWSCELVAKWLQEKTPFYSVLEIGTGKGGKILSTLSAWTEKYGGKCEKIPSFEWTAVDSSYFQLAKLKTDAQPLIHKIWPQIHLQIKYQNFEAADVVWLDAPCTGFGTLSKNPEIGLKYGEIAKKFSLELSAQQKKLCGVALSCVKPGGFFVYTVCTLTSEETFDVVKYCQDHLGAKLEFVSSLWPSQQPSPQAEGFFIAKFVRG